MFKAAIKCICGWPIKNLRRLVRWEEGQALPIVLAVLALGAIIIGPFLSHAGTALKSSGQFNSLIAERYAGEAGVEQAIWNLTYSNLATLIPNAGNSRSYNLPNQVNALTDAIKVTHIASNDGLAHYLISSKAGGTTITSEVARSGSSCAVVSWDISP